MRTIVKKSTVKKIIAGIATVYIVACSLFSIAAYADGACDIAGVDDPLICGTNGGDEEVELLNRIRSVLNVVYLWIGIIAVIFVVIGGISYMTSQGDAQKIQRAKSTITYSLCGLVVTLAAFAITSTIINSLDGVSPGETVADDGSGGLFGADRYKVKSISAINQTSIIVGQKFNIHAKVIPDYAENKKLSYKSSDNSIATVDANGVVTSKKDGEVTITISSSDGPSKNVKITIKKPIPVTKIELSTKDVTVDKNKSVTVKATAIPKNATDKTLIWSSANDKVAVVTQAGVIKGLGEGESTTVTVTARNKDTIAMKATDVQLANFQLAAANSVKETINVSVKGTKLNFAYKGNGAVKSQFSSANMKIIEKHLYDLNYNNYHDVINKKYGGKFENYAKTVGGIYGEYYNKTMNAKTEYDFQMAAEYVFGWMYMIGFDYHSGGGNYYKWGSGGGNTHSDDAFYPGTMNYTGAWGGQGFDKELASKDGHDRAMLTECGPTAWATLEKAGMGNLQAISKPASKKDLRPGDLVRFFNHKVTDEASTKQADHVALVGEVYKDRIVIYDGGSYYITNRNFKRTVPIDDSKSMLGFTDWVAERYRNLKKQ